MLRFVGSVWQEDGETRGKIEFISEKDGKPAGIRYFQSFEVLRQMIEQEYKLELRDGSN